MPAGAAGARRSHDGLDGTFAHHGTHALIASGADFAGWRAGEPLEGTHVVHYCGELVAGLPAEFTPRGPGEWHQYSTEFPSLPAAIDHALAVLEAARAQRPDLREGQDHRDGSFEGVARYNHALVGAARDAHARQHAGRLAGLSAFYAGGDAPVFQLAIDAVSDFSRATTTAAGRGALYPVTFGDGERGLLWKAVHGDDDGLVDVGADAEAGAVVLATINGDDEDAEARARAHATTVPDDDAAAVLDVPDGVLVVATALLAIEQIDALAYGTPEELAALVADRAASPLDGVMGEDGLVLRVRPGHYSVHHGHRNDAGWSVAWCRLVYRGATTAT